MIANRHVHAAMGLAALLLAWIGTATSAHAVTRWETIDGATCIPYPPYQTNTAIPYQQWLYGFSQRAYCHLTMSTEWPLAQLSYVLFTGSASAGAMTARLCVHSGDFAVSCGTPHSIVPGGSVNWVAPPSPLPTGSSGAFVQFDFPAGAVSTVRQLTPVWYH